MVNVNDLAIFYFFSTFSMEQLKQISEITDKKVYKKHDHVYERGDRANHLFVVNKGLVCLKRFDHGENVGITFEASKSGEIFGAASFMHPRHYTLTAVCMEDSEVLAIDADKLSDLCQKDPAVGHKLMLKIAQIYFERYMKSNS